MNPEYKPPYNKWLHRYAVLVAICTLFLVVAGASVTSQEAGLSVPDWPLSYGQVLPEMTGGVFYETGHRLVATTVGMLTILLAVWIQRADERQWMKKLGWAALGAVIVQGLLGGMTVLWLQPPAVSTAHACLAQLFFSMTCSIALFTSKRWLRGAEIVEDYGRPSLRTLAIIAPILVLGQIALGAAFRHRAIGLIPHIAGSMVVTLSLLIVGIFVLTQFPKHDALRKAAHGMLGITAMQVFLGIAAYYVRIAAAEQHAQNLAVEHPLQLVLITVAHVANGGLTLAFTILLSIHIRRNVRLRGTTQSQTQAVVAS